jgi:hypothetical protein
VKIYTFSKRADGSYRCDSTVAGDGACLVRRTNDGVWETATIPDPHSTPHWIACPTADASATRRGAVVAHFFYYNTLFRQGVELARCHMERH